MEINPVAAFGWLKRAADAGHAAAQNTVGESLRTGVGAPKNAEEGVKYLRRAAVQGTVDAMYNLAVCHHNGDGLEKDEVQEFTWLQRAKLAGDVTAAREMDEHAASLSKAKRREHDALVAGVRPIPPPKSGKQPIGSGPGY